MSIRDNLVTLPREPMATVGGWVERASKAAETHGQHLGTGFSTGGWNMGSGIGLGIAFGVGGGLCAIAWSMYTCALLAHAQPASVHSAANQIDTSGARRGSAAPLN
jgi:hypothetical protein